MSVDELLKMELGYANDEECPICGHDHEDHEPIGARKKFKKNLHSLLISKLPEKRLDAVKQGEMIPFDGEHKVEMDWLRKCQDAGFNEALANVKAVLDELFEVQNG